MDFSGKHIIVTGGTGALGTAVVRALTSRGATCHIPAFDPREVDRFPLKDHALVRTTLGIDLAREDSVAGFYSAAASAGTLWASIHIAGGFAMAPIHEAPLAQFEGMIRTNLTTCWLCCREAVRAMRTAGAGRIVNVAARPGLSPEQGASMTAYTASKAAVVALTRSLAAEVAKDGIVVTAIAPSIMDTPANRAAMPAADHASWPKVEQVAEMIAMLASPGNTLAGGAIVPVYGRA